MHVLCGMSAHYWGRTRRSYMENCWGRSCRSYIRYPGFRPSKPPLQAPSVYRFSSHCGRCPPPGKHPWSFALRQIRGRQAGYRSQMDRFLVRISTHTSGERLSGT